MLSGTEVIKELIDGYESGIITAIYGPASAGKTCMCILASIDAARKGKKVLFIDSEGGFSVQRLQQLAEDYEKIMDKMVFLKPTSFKEQEKVFEKMKDMINEKFGLIVVDTIGNHYRVERSKCSEVTEVNNALVNQLSTLSEIARKINIPIIITNQVYSDFENKDQVKIVGGDILKYSSKCMIELQKLKGPYRKAILRKHRHIKEDKEVTLEIQEKGMFVVD